MYANLAFLACPMLAEGIRKVHREKEGQDALEVRQEAKNKKGTVRHIALSSNQGTAKARQEIMGLVSQLYSGILDSSPTIT